MKIEIKRKQPKPIELVFEKKNIKGKQSKVIIRDVDNQYISASINLCFGLTRVPSTLLSRWVNINLADKLSTLVDRCNTVETIKLNGKGKGLYHFTNKEDSIFGLHKCRIQGVNEYFREVSIDDSIGMTNVVAILREIGYNTEVEYDSVKSTVVKISLFEEV